MTICEMCKKEKKCPFIDKQPSRKRYTNEEMIKILRDVNPRCLNAYDWSAIQQVIMELSIRTSEGK